MCAGRGSASYKGETHLVLQDILVTPPDSPGEEGVEGLGENELPVDGHERPEGAAHIQGDRQSQGCEHVVLETSHQGQLLPGQHLVRPDEIVDQADGVVDRLEDLQWTGGLATCTWNICIAEVKSLGVTGEPEGPRFTYCIDGREVFHLPSKVIRDSWSLGPGDAVEVVIDTVAHHERPGEMHQDGTEVAGSVSHSLGFGHFEGTRRH